MSGRRQRSRLESLTLSGAERHVRHDLEVSAAEPARPPRGAVLAAALALFAGGFALRLSVDDPGALVANFYTVPIALLAMVYGVRAGLAAAGLALFLVWAWGQLDHQHVGVLGYSTRGAVFLLVGVLVGYYAERLRRDIAERRRAEAELSLRARDLEVSNSELTRAVIRLEAFAEIAHAAGGETELEAMLERILREGVAIVEARMLAAYLEEDGELVRVAAIGPDTPPELVVPLVWQGESLGALAAGGPLRGESFGEETQDLLASVAASAATAVATARSVAADRLRHTIQASEQARTRWARELHDETLQGLVGLRMQLASARRSGSADRLEEAVGHALEQTRRQIVELRGLIAELRPAALDELGLGPAIETLASRSAESAGLDVVTSIELRDGALPRLAAETETVVYRLVQEALTNAAKHSGADAVQVTVAEGERLIDVIVADDGRGFDAATPATGFGLRGMRERIELAGGTLTIDSSPEGSTVRARVPASRLAPPAAIS